MGALSDLAATIETARGIGDNNPPEPTPYDGFAVHIGDLYGEAKNFLDGAEIASEAEATAVSALLDQIRTAAKDADKARAAEKKPHDDAGKAVQAKWKPLLDKADLATDAAKKALVPWLVKVEAENRAKAEAARKEAEEKAALAAEAARQASLTDLDAREKAEELVKEAKRAEAAATKAEGEKAHATGGARAVGLRSYFSAELTDPAAALAHYRASQPEALKAFLLTLAQTDVLNGARSVPGFTITEERRAA